MNKRERAILAEVYRGLNEMTGLCPINPANIQAISTNLRTCTRAASDLMYAVSHLGFGEYEEAEAFAADARAALDAGRK